MDGKYLVSSPVTSNIQASAAPTKRAPAPDKTARTTELQTGIQQPMITRQTAPSITLGNE